MIKRDAIKPYVYGGDWTWMSGDGEKRRTICYRDIKGDCYKETHWQGVEQVDQVDPKFYEIFIRDFAVQVKPAEEFYNGSFAASLDEL